MKKWIFLFVLGISLSGHAQLPVKLKYDQLIYSYDSATVLVLKGNSTSIYDLSEGNLLLGPTKNHLINFPQTNMYAEIPVKSGDIWIHWFNGDAHTAVRGSDSLCYIGFDQPEFAYGMVDLNGYEYNVETNDFTGNMTDKEKIWSQAKIEKVRDNIYLIQSYRSRSIDALFDEKNPDRVVYNMSGVFNLNTENWIIKPEFKSCYFLNDFVFCLNKDVSENGNFSGTHNVFHLTPQGANLVAGNITAIPDSILAEILWVDGVSSCGDQIHYLTNKNGKLGLVRFHLADPIDSKFEYKEILEPTADFMYYEPFYEKLIMLYRDSINSIHLYHVTQDSDSLIKLASDSMFVTCKWHYNDIILWTSAGCFEIVETENSEFEIKPREDFYSTETSVFGLNFVNDSTAIFSDFFHFDELIFLKSILYPGEDSLDYEGNVVYERDEPLFSKGGVYNLNSGNWIVSPQYQSIDFLADGFLANRYQFYDRSEKKSDELFMSYYHADGSPCFLELTHDEISRDINYLKCLIPYKNPDSMFLSPAAFNHHSQLEIKQKSYYVMCGDMLGLYLAGWNFENDFRTGLYDFIHYNAGFDVTIYLEQDSIYLLSNFDTVAVSQVSGKIIYYQPDQYGTPLDNYRIIAIEGKDTISKSERWDLGYKQTMYISAEIINGNLIINDHNPRANLSCIECRDIAGDHFNRSLYIGSENSSVWKKSGNRWVKVSLFYATIHPVSNGWFIVSTGFYDEELEYWEYSNDSTYAKSVDARYLILDSNFNAISLLDYFDFPYIQDLGFGISVRLDSGYSFFVTYDGVAITNAEWDRFELENGKLKAVLDTKYEVDEDGDLILNEFGVPNEIVSQTIRYYTLP